MAKGSVWVFDGAMDVIALKQCCSMRFNVGGTLLCIVFAKRFSTSVPKVLSGNALRIICAKAQQVFVFPQKYFVFPNRCLVFGVSLC